MNLDARIIALGTALPPYLYAQDEIFHKIGYTRDSLKLIFRRSGIDTRSLALCPGEPLSKDPEWFAKHYEKWTPDLAEQALRSALDNAGLLVEDLDYLVATSCTGYLCPALGTVVAHRLGLKSSAKTASLIGMGCNAALPAFERVSEFLAMHPEATVATVSAEICSATYWIDDDDLESAVGNAIFADGAAAAIFQAGGDQGRVAKRGKPLVEFVQFTSTSIRKHIGDMGFRSQAGRLRVVLSRDVPEHIMPAVVRTVDTLLSSQKLPSSDIHHWVVHPGGPKILQAFDERWGLEQRLAPSREVLRRHGNMSSPTILFVLNEFLTKNRARPGELGLMLAMGPGLSVEGALIRFL